MLYPCLGRAVVQYIILGQVTKWPFKGEQSGEMQLGQMWNSVSSWIVFLGVQCVLRCAMCNSRTKQRSQRKGKSWLQSLELSDQGLREVFRWKSKGKGDRGQVLSQSHWVWNGFKEVFSHSHMLCTHTKQRRWTAMERDGRIWLILEWPRLHSTRFPLQLWF